MGNLLSLGETKAMPIETTFNLPLPLPSWPQSDTNGTGFGSGRINLGGLEVRQISTFNKIWAIQEGGPDNRGASFFEPSPIPRGYFSLGSYCQPNNQPLYGWVLVGKDVGCIKSPSLAIPVDYKLIWSSENSNLKQDGVGYIWSPVPPEGYNAIGNIVTNSRDKPGLDKIRCVRSDLTDSCEHASIVWGGDGINVYNLRPTSRGPQALGVSVGTFTTEMGGTSTPSSSTMSCLKNSDSNLSSCMPNQNQIQTLFQTYSPLVYFHPDEPYLPSSVSWYFNNGVLLHDRGNESNPVPIDSNGMNLPQGGSSDGLYWLDLPSDKGSKEKVKKGDLQSSETYLQVKPMFGGTYTDIAIWVFYPFNGPARAKIKFINVNLGRIGEHVGDWEHLTLRISNFSGELHSVYFSEHSKGIWVNSPELEFQDGNKPVAYSSLHGHAFYPKPGLVVQGNGGIGIRNDTAKSKTVMNTGERYEIVSAEYLGTIVEPPWLNYAREWGPKIEYDIARELKGIGRFLPGKLKDAFYRIMKGLPNEVLGQEGPTGPKMKSSWNGEERV
ncbi:hypothetical protein C5167_000278 [Papaver somniferum]|uniref:Vacuolar protein sorting-associated protein 62 n=1 Tax=Papaver somniferum TaxID=3469 RepID=A0A4Y7KS03_PAPSO|nr:uncharacterized protein LOC113308755 [Papaver somniferum]RZC76123.1 hypothetical protein C5167_000278 [Papaver somniferum]